MNLEQIKRTMWISTAASMVIIAALIFVIIMQFHLWRSLQADIIVAEEQLVQLEQRLMRLSLLKENQAELARQLAVMQKTLPGEISEQDLLLEMQKAALLAGCRVSEFRFGDRVFHEHYTEIPLDLSLEGRFASLVALLDNINRASRIYRVRELSIQSNGNDGLIRADLQISSFYVD
ncbi:MAG TPA: type 4a pilus biogenesis protein PilO [Clostridia bacterium]|nr:type 4a pilus biogenesis protein PilO [Clostridia bacterium]